jgi:hypothetical protein
MYEFFSLHALAAAGPALFTHNVFPCDLCAFAVSNLFSLRPLGNCSMRYPTSCIHAVVRLCGEESVYAACAQTVKTPLSFDLDSIFR